MHHGRMQHAHMCPCAHVHVRACTHAHMHTCTCACCAPKVVSGDEDLGLAVRRLVKDEVGELLRNLRPVLCDVIRVGVAKLCEGGEAKPRTLDRLQVLLGGVGLGLGLGLGTLDRLQVLLGVDHVHAHVHMHTDVCVRCACMRCSRAHAHRRVCTMRMHAMLACTGQGAPARMHVRAHAHTRTCAHAHTRTRTLGMIMSVSMFWMSSGAAAPLRLTNFGMPPPPDDAPSRMIGPAESTASAYL